MFLWEKICNNSLPNFRFPDYLFPKPFILVKLAKVTNSNSKKSHKKNDFYAESRTCSHWTKSRSCLLVKILFNYLIPQFTADNQTKRRRHNLRKKDFSVFNQPTESHRVSMSPQLTLATCQYLQTSKIWYVYCPSGGRSALLCSHMPMPGD